MTLPPELARRLAELGAARGATPDLGRQALRAPTPTPPVSTRG